MISLNLTFKNNEVLYFIKTPKLIQALKIRLNSARLAVLHHGIACVCAIRLFCRDGEKMAAMKVKSSNVVSRSVELFSSCL